MEKKSNLYSLILFSLVFLFIPNINVIDLMPDFVAWFILAKVFERAADSAPYFEEARAGFIKLGYVNLAKILGFIIIILVKSRDTSDNNIFALVSLCFAIVEMLFIIPTVNNVFQALFHLGERSDAAALITSQTPSKRCLFRRVFSVELAKEFTFVFFTVKTVAYTLPDFFLLTRITDKGYFVNFSRAYPIVLLICQTVALFFGILWLIKMIKYMKAVRSEGKFNAALDLSQSEDSFGRYVARARLRSAKFVLTLTSVASLFTLEISFSNWSGINILPHFIYLSLMLVSALLMLKHAKPIIAVYPLGGAAIIVSFITYILKISFLSRYSYEDIATDSYASLSYKTIEIFALIEMLLTVAFLLFFMLLVNSFTARNTGIFSESERSSRSANEYHRSLKNKNLIIFIFGTVSAVAKLLNVFVNGKAQLIFTDESDVTAGAFYAASLPWFNLVVTGTALLYIFFTFYYMSNLKDEVKMKSEYIPTHDRRDV